MVGSRGRLTITEVNLIIQLSNDGVFRHEIARRLDINPVTVWKHQKKFCLV
ncbi:MAG: hypothetical protein ACW991_00750 [Candidatus Hodarchaeales archaeon]|jgi:DNA-binding CsgD family transcriptional regulator